MIMSYEVPVSWCGIMSLGLVALVNNVSIFLVFWRRISRDSFTSILNPFVLCCNILLRKFLLLNVVSPEILKVYWVYHVLSVLMSPLISSRSASESVRGELSPSLCPLLFCCCSCKLALAFPSILWITHWWLNIPLSASLIPGFATRWRTWPSSI